MIIYNNRWQLSLSLPRPVSSYLYLVVSTPPSPSHTITCEIYWCFDALGFLTIFPQKHYKHMGFPFNFFN